jgi:hypothetical protein
VPRVPTASRRLLLLLFAVAGLAVPSSAASKPSAPSITFERHVVGTAGANGWYVSNVQVYWTFDPPPSQTQGCDAVTITGEGTTQLDCIAWWGQTRLEDPVTISIDKTAPTVTGHPSRPPDANGWYNKPVTISFTGTDSTSGVAGCGGSIYAGPDSGNASVAGTCTDNAGNVGRATYGFSYDSTPPTVGNVTAKHGNRRVLLSWTASADTQVSQVTRTGGANGSGNVVYRGSGTSFRDKGLKPGAKYVYTVTAFDAAANPATKTLAVTGTGRLINPVPGERVTSPPRLAWLPVKHASYYNVQLIRGGRILSAWPTRANFKLPKSWIYHGHRYRLRPGVYRWYIWPGFGKLAQAHYGRLLGGSSFVFAG